MRRRSLVRSLVRVSAGAAIVAASCATQHPYVEQGEVRVPRAFVLRGRGSNTSDLKILETTRTNTLWCDANGCTETPR